MNIPKIKAMLGFSIKSGKIIYGIDNIEQSRKPVYVILADQQLSGRTKTSLEKIATTKNVTLITLKDSLEEMVGKTGCKVVAVLDKNMAENIIMNAGNGGGSILD